MKFMNWLVAVLTVPLGFILALIVAWIAELFSVGSWFIGTLIAVFFVGLFALEKLMDWIWDPIANRIFPVPELDAEEKKLESKRSRYAFVVGVLLGLITVWIWSAQQVLSLL